MSFVTAFALAIGLLVAAPTLAHLLRRGRAREQPFPPTAWVPDAKATTRERSRLEDRGLLALRALLIGCLAIVGAGPLVQCSRVALGRSAGASVALALVIDDSASMRARLPNSDRSRFERAIAGAVELLGSAREGDAVAIVLAGKPARLLLAAGTDLSSAERQLRALAVTDRATDLSSAVSIARASLSSLPHRDKRVVLLSDLAGDVPREGAPRLWAPLPELAVRAPDCGVASAEQTGQRVVAVVACSDAEAARGRTVRLAPRGKEPEARGEVRLVQHDGEQPLVLSAPVGFDGDVVITGGDQNPNDDRAPIQPEATELAIGVHADSASGSAATGGPPLLEQAVSSLATPIPLRPLAELPADVAELRGLLALLIDDPAGFTPETRLAMESWVSQGAVAVAFLGARATDTQLGSTLEPFVRGAVDWEQLSRELGLDPATLGWLGVEAQSLTELHAKGRARLDSALLPGAEVSGRWEDGKVFVSRKQHGRGLVYTVGLPVSAEQSDWPLRPGFLSLLDRVASEATERRGPRTSVAGTEWSFPAGLAPKVVGPNGSLELRDAEGQRVAVPEAAGRYEITTGAARETRYATLPPEEITALPRGDLPAELRLQQAAGAAPLVDASPELGWLLLALVALECLVRATRLVRTRTA